MDKRVGKYEVGSSVLNRERSVTGVSRSGSRISVPPRLVFGSVSLSTAFESTHPRAPCLSRHFSLGRRAATGELGRRDSREKRWNAGATPGLGWVGLSSGLTHPLIGPSFGGGIVKRRPKRREREPRQAGEGEKDTVGGGCARNSSAVQQLAPTVGLPHERLVLESKECKRQEREFCAYRMNCHLDCYFRSLPVLLLLQFFLLRLLFLLLHVDCRCWCCCCCCCC